MFEISAGLLFLNRLLRQTFGSYTPEPISRTWWPIRRTIICECDETYKTIRSIMMNHQFTFSHWLCCHLKTMTSSSRDLTNSLAVSIRYGSSFGTVGSHSSMHGVHSGGAQGERVVVWPSPNVTNASHMYQNSLLMYSMRKNKELQRLVFKNWTVIKGKCIYIYIYIYIKGKLSEINK